MTETSGFDRFDDNKLNDAALSEEPPANSAAGIKASRKTESAPHPSQLDWPELPAADLGRWFEPTFGDVRDNLRAALSAGADTADDLHLIACALDTIANEESAFDDEESATVLRSAAGILRERINTLDAVSRFLWDCAFTWGNSFQ